MGFWRGCLVGVAVAFGSLAASGSTTTGVAGVALGFPTTATCGAGQALAGVNLIPGRAGQVVGGFTLRCVAVGPDGRWSGAVSGSDAGAPDLGYLHIIRARGREMLCPRDTSIRRADWYVRDDVTTAGVARVRFYCGGPGGSSQMESPAILSEGVLVSPPACPDGTMATGLIGRSGSFVHQAGLLCGPPGPEAIAAAARSEHSYDEFLNYHAGKGKLPIGKTKDAELKPLQGGGVDWAVGVDRKTGERRYFYLTALGISGQGTKDHRKLKNPLTGEADFCCSYGVADTQYRSLVEPVYAEITVIGPHTALARRLDRKLVLINLDTAAETAVDADDSLALQDDMTLLIKNTGGDRNRITLLGSDGTPAATFDNIESWRKHTLSQMILVQAQPSGEAQTLWVNAEGTLLARLPRHVLEDGASGADGIQFAPQQPQFAEAAVYMDNSPALGRTHIADKRMFFPITQTGRPMPLPPDVLGYVYFICGKETVPNDPFPDPVTGHCRALVEQKQGQLRFYVDTSPYLRDTLVHYVQHSLTPYSDLEETIHDVITPSGKAHYPLLGQRADGKWEFVDLFHAFVGQTRATPEELQAMAKQSDDAIYAARMEEIARIAQEKVERDRRMALAAHAEAVERERRSQELLAYQKRQAEINYAIDNAGKVALDNVEAAMKQMHETAVRQNRENCEAAMKGANRNCNVVR